MVGQSGSAGLCTTVLVIVADGPNREETYCETFPTAVPTPANCIEAGEIIPE